MAHNQRAMTKRTLDPDVDADTLTRQAAGDYRSADGRFTVRQADQGWFLVDTSQTNEFGQELIHGPFRSLKAVREAMPGARTQKVVPLRRTTANARGRARKEEPPPPPPSWIDQLPMPEGRAVRKLIAALEREGVADAEDLVRRDRDGLLPAVATRLITARLAALVDDADETDRKGMRALVQRVAEVLTSEGSALRDPLPSAFMRRGTDPPIWAPRAPEERAARAS